MPEMSEENYQAIMKKFDELEKKQEALDKKITDVTNFNNALLQTADDNGKIVSPSARKKELEEKLKGAFKHA